MPTVDATPGGAAANSYLTVAESTTYHATIPEVWRLAWDDAVTADREAALILATRMLDASMKWTGAAATTTQALAWPRSGMVSRNGVAILSTVVPQELKNATAEFARQLLEANRTADSDIARLGITDLKAGSVSLSFKETVPTFAVSRVVPDAVLLLLVSTWYTTAAAEYDLFKVI